MISMVVAMSENRAIGFKGQLPWHLPKDLKHFKELTLGKTILMGRKTFDSLKKPLPGRTNLVMTTDPTFGHDGIQVVHGLEDLNTFKLDELFVIGGQDIYRLFLPKAEKIYLTLVHAVIPGDVFFPNLSGFLEIGRQYHPQDEKHQYAFSFIEYYRSTAR